MKWLEISSNTHIIQSITDTLPEMHVFETHRGQAGRHERFSCRCFTINNTRLLSFQSNADYSRRRGVMVNGVDRINKVNQHRAQLVLGWVTVFGRVNHLGM